jgi:hypothetical protein
MTTSAEAAFLIVIGRSARALGGFLKSVSDLRKPYFCRRLQLLLEK